MTTIGSTPADTQRAPTPMGFGWLPGALVAFTIAVVAAAALFLVLSDNPDTSRTATEVATPAATAQGVYDEDLYMAQLANTGQIPHAAVNWDTVELKRLVNMGLVPAAALESATMSVEPLFTETELLEIDLANRGIIPRETVDWEIVELKRLVNMGLVPAAALEN